MLQQPATWRGEVFVLALASAIPATLVDVYLLDRKLGLFSGGYLAEHRIDSPGRIALFLALSVLTDVAVLAPIVAAVLWVARLRWMHAVSRVFLALSLTLAVVAAADVAVYELQRYVGDLVNVGVLVDLIGGDIREILYFTVSPALNWLGFLSLGALVIVGASVVLDQWFPSQMRQDPGARRTTFAALVLVLGTALTLGAVARLNDPAFDRGMRFKPGGRVMGSLTQWLTDVDRDGYGLLATPADPAPFDAAIHPYAVDMPGNGIDENGLGGDLPPGEAYREPEFPPVTFTRRPDVVFVILESFRADAVGTSLNGKPVTPTLDRLVRDGAAATRAYSHNGFTIQSRYHAFTGHLVGPGNPGSIVDDFNANGYETAFFSAQDETFGNDYDVGFERARVRYDARVDRHLRFTQFATPASLTVSWKVLEERVTTFLEGRDARVPLFLHLNLQDGHFPYTNPDILPLVDGTSVRRQDFSPSNATLLRRMYLNTLANVDAALGRLLERVALTTGRQPGVVVIADHGESLFDEGFLGHGYAVNDAQTRIPFIVNNLPVTIPDPVGQLDVRPLLRSALTSGTSGTALRSDPSRWVFQYVGTLRSPTAIAATSLSGQRRLNLLSPTRARDAEGQSMRELLHLWERAAGASRPR